MQAAENPARILITSGFDDAGHDQGTVAACSEGDFARLGRNGPGRPSQTTSWNDPPRQNQIGAPLLSWREPSGSAPNLLPWRRTSPEPCRR